MLLFILLLYLLLLVRFFFCHYHSEEQTVSNLSKTNYNIFRKAFFQSKYQICKKLIRNLDYNISNVYINVKLSSYCPYHFQNHFLTIKMVNRIIYYRSILKSSLKEYFKMYTKKRHKKLNQEIYLNQGKL